ncbi:MAG: sn-glycerol-3-phosphate ABC transporter ATP-binding protein UgpC [Candidatus Kapaibacteriales bacterium]
MNIPNGTFLVLVGPSGCGKSTLLRMIAGLETISEGKLEFDKRIVNHLEPKERNIGMVFQNYALYPHMTIAQNIGFPLKIAKTKKAEIKTRVEETARLTGIFDLLERKPKEISGGQRQRAALARAIIKRPDIFLFDEPLSNLDAKLRTEMRTEIASLHRKLGTTSIYVTHDQVEAVTLGEMIVVLNEGEIMQIGTPEEIYSKPQNLFVAKFIGQPQINTLSCRLKDKMISFRGEALNLNADIEDQSVTAAFRPEDVTISEIFDENGFLSVKARLINKENHGHEQILFFDSEGERLKIRTSLDAQYSLNNEYILKTRMKDILFFDEVGERIILSN